MTHQKRTKARALSKGNGRVKHLMRVANSVPTVNLYSCKSLILKQFACNGFFVGSAYRDIKSEPASETGAYNANDSARLSISIVFIACAYR